MTQERKPEALVAYLDSLVRDEDRATLALLRGSLQPGRSLDALRVVLPFLPRESHPTQRRRDENDALLLAGLFALHQDSGSASIARALRSLIAQSDSVELRFRALLASSREDLPEHLRYAVSLLAGNRVALDWSDLYRAVRRWDHPDDYVRRQWARDFWTPDDAPASTTP